MNRMRSAGKSVDSTRRDVSEGEKLKPMRRGTIKI